MVQRDRDTACPNSWLVRGKQVTVEVPSVGLSKWCDFGGLVVHSENFLLRRCHTVELPFFDHF